MVHTLFKSNMFSERNCVTMALCERPLTKSEYESRNMNGMVEWQQWQLLIRTASTAKRGEGNFNLALKTARDSKNLREGQESIDNNRTNPSISGGVRSQYAWGSFCEAFCRRTYLVLVFFYADFAGWNIPVVNIRRKRYHRRPRDWMYLSLRCDCCSRNELRRQRFAWNQFHDKRMRRGQEAVDFCHNRSLF